MLDSLALNVLTDCLGSKAWTIAEYQKNLSFHPSGILEQSWLMCRGCHGRSECTLHSQLSFLPWRLRFFLGKIFLLSILLSLLHVLHLCPVPLGLICTYHCVSLSLFVREPIVMPSSAFAFTRSLKLLALKIIKNDGVIGGGRGWNLKAYFDIDLSIYFAGLIQAKHLFCLILGHSSEKSNFNLVKLTRWWFSGLG